MTSISFLDIFSIVLVLLKFFEIEIDDRLQKITTIKNQCIMINFLLLSKLFFRVDADPIYEIIFMLSSLFTLNPR